MRGAELGTIVPPLRPAAPATFPARGEGRAIAVFAVDVICLAASEERQGAATPRMALLPPRGGGGRRSRTEAGSRSFPDHPGVAPC